MDNLPEIPSRKPEQVVVGGPINGHPSEGAFVNQINPQRLVGTGAPPIPPATHYYTWYKIPGVEARYSNTFASVDVTFYPNKEWAQYELRNIPTTNSAILYPERNISVTKFGNQILMNASMRASNGLGELYFFWRSGERLVFVRFYREEDDEFLGEYLRLHPSSL